MVNASAFIIVANLINMFTWRFILDKMRASQGVVLLYVLQSKGSSPGRQGFHMAVAADGTMHGSIGGGIMEHKFVEMAKARLQQTMDANQVYRQVHDKAAPAQQSGMICSGEQTLFLYSLQDSDRLAIEALVQSVLHKQNGSLILSQQGVQFSDAIPEKDYDCSQSTEEDFKYIEKTGYKNVLHIIGGGHCSLALSRLMRTMDFYIHVYEHRQELNTLIANEYAHAIHVVSSYNELSERVHGGKNEYVVIMTFGYRTDDEAVRALMGKSFRYIGLMGSKKKIEKMFARYKAEKFKNKFLKKICTPVGLKIKSETPSEIAVSIAAEIISVKNSDQ